MIQVSVRLVYNPHVLWSMCGVLSRIAQRIGLHKDGSKLGLSVFETEIRRRTWWRILVTDSTIGHMAGCESFAIYVADTKTPSNLDDSALDPDMKELPVESSGATEMIFCLMCYDLGMWLYKHAERKTSTFDGYWASLNSSSIALDKKDRMIDELEHMFQSRYLNYCDSSIPLHLMTQLVARSVIAVTRLRAHHPRQYQENGQEMPQSERNLLFGYCKTIVESAVLLFSTDKMLRFMWHADFHFPWEPIIVMLSELREHPIGDHVKEGWLATDRILQIKFKNLDRGITAPLELAVANLAIKAWSAHIAESENRRIAPLPQPESITIYWRYLQRLRASKLPHAAAIGTVSTSSGHHYPDSLFSAGRTTPSDTLTTISESSYTVKDNYVNSGSELSPARFKHAADTMNSDLDMNIISEMYPVEDIPMDWVQWDDMLQQFQAQSSGEIDIFFPPPLGQF